MSKLKRITPVFGLVLLAASLFVPASVAAASYTTTRFDDPAPGACLATDCSLREAVIAANAAAGSVITLKAGTYTLTIRGVDTNPPNAKVGDLDVMKPMTINGAGNAATFIQAGASKGAGIHRIFDTYAAAPGATISNMTIRFGTDVESKTGGCVRNTGKLTLSRVIVTGCTSSRGGGGIASYANLTVADSTISNNAAFSGTIQVNGGGIVGGPQSSGAPGSVTIVRTTITNNSARSTRPKIAYGGGFANTANMTIQDSVVSDNQADSSAGGLTDPRLSKPPGSLNVVRTTFSGNKASRDAGGLTNDGVATISASTFTGNQAGYACAGTDCNQGYAGGVLSTNSGTTRVYNSTFSGNASPISGGGLLQSGNGNLTVRSSTVVNNSSGYAGGIAGSSPGTTGQVYLMNSIVANNTARNAADCGGPVTSQGYNLVETCVLTGNGTGNVLGRDPMLGPLASNGGPTQTHALLAGSPAINAGDPTGCKDTAGAVLTTDQRGSPRAAAGRCDIGAYESPA